MEKHSWESLVGETDSIVIIIIIVVINISSAHRRKPLLDPAQALECKSCCRDACFQAVEGMVIFMSHLSWVRACGVGVKRTSVSLPCF